MKKNIIISILVALNVMLVSVLVAIWNMDYVIDFNIGGELIEGRQKIGDYLMGRD